MTEETEREDERAQDGAEEDEMARGAGEEGSVGPAASESGTPGTGGTAIGDDLDGLRDELSALNDRHLRLAAEFDNYRKRSERDRQALVSRLQANLVASLLDVLDDLQRVAASEPNGTAESVVEGVRLVEKKFLGILEGAGLEAVDAEGAPFDPEVMEALMTVPTDDPAKDHHVADVFQTGYRFRDTLLRPARVRVLQYESSSEGD